MLESDLWYRKTVNKNVKGAKMMGFLKACDQYPHKLYCGHLFSSLRVFSFFSIFFLFCDDDKNLGESFTWGALVKMTIFSFFDSQIHFTII